MFTRFEPAPVVTEDYGIWGWPYEEHLLPAIRHGLRQSSNLVKAFFTLDRNALRSWQERPHVKARIQSLRDGADRWVQQRRQRGENISDRVVRRCDQHIFLHILLRMR